MSEQEGWNPISSAPRDRMILLFFPGSPPIITLGEWYDSQHYRNGKLVYESKGWSREDSALLMGYPKAEPTHWMELPAPPRGLV